MSIYTRWDVENCMEDIIWCIEECTGIKYSYFPISKNWLKYTPQQLFPEPIPENSRVYCFS